MALEYVNYLLGEAKRKAAENVNVPDAPKIDKVKALRDSLVARGSLTPISTSTPDVNAASITPRPLTPTLPVSQSPLEKLQMEQENLALNPNAGRNGETLQKHGRVRNFIEGFLSSAGQNANRALAQGNVGWGGVAQALGGGAGGGAVQAIDPGIDLRARHEKAIAENQADLDRLTATSLHDAQIQDVKAHTEARGAAADARDRELGLRSRGLDIRESDMEADNALAAKRYELDEKFKTNQISYGEWKQKHADYDLQEKRRHNRVQEGIGQQNAEANTTRANRPSAGATGNPDAAYSRADELQRELDALDAQDKSEPTFNPIIDRTTGEVMKNAKGEVMYSNTPTPAYKDRQRRKQTLVKEKEQLFKEARKTSNRVSTSVGAGRPFSVSAWAAANPGKDANKAAAQAASKGFKVVK